MLCGSMDQTTLLVDLSQPEGTVLQAFHDHKKYAV